MAQFTCSDCQKTIIVHKGRVQRRNRKPVCVSCLYSTPAPAAPPPAVRTAPAWASLPVAVHAAARVF